MATADEKQDKYEQLLAKIDWRAPHPPRGYQYGIGRGARAFVTTAELSTAEGATIGKLSRAEDDFFSDLERVENKKKKDASSKKELSEGEESRATSSTVQKLSLDDLATLEMGFGVSHSTPAASTADAAPAKQSTNTAAPAAPAPPLVLRSARTEEGEAAEEHLFGEERVLTAYDVLKGRTSALQSGLQHVLDMGSTAEQATWITHARAYREMGMLHKALQTLKEGCAQTGSKGRRIWEERLHHASKEPHVRRQILEEAVAACAWEDHLWLLYIDTALTPGEKIALLQRAVLACPSSEVLWVRLVQHVPRPGDQRALLHKALQHTPSLPLLWGRLARLESYETGRKLFQAAAAQHPSLTLLIEAATYVEWSLLHSTSVQVSSSSSSPLSRSSALTDAMKHVQKEVGQLVGAAQKHYLALGEDASRQAWLDVAVRQVCPSHDESGALVEDDRNTPNPTDNEKAPSRLPQRYIITASYMLLAVVDPHNGSSIKMPSTWLSDLSALLPEKAMRSTGMQAALWYTWLCLQARYPLNKDVYEKVQKEAEATRNGAAAHPSSATIAKPEERDPTISIKKETVNAEEEEEEELGSTKFVATQRHAWLDALVQAPLVPPPEMVEVMQRVISAVTAEEVTEAFDYLPSLPSSASAAVKAEPPGAEEEEEEELATTLPSASAPPRRTVYPFSLLLCFTVNAVEMSSRERIALTPPVWDASVPLAMSDALFYKGFIEEATQLLTEALRRRQPSPPLRMVVALATLFAARGDAAGADACLVGAMEQLTERMTSPDRTEAEARAHKEGDVVWVKLAIHRRSLGQEVVPLLEDGIRKFPRSTRLWLMLLEERRRLTIKAHEAAVAGTSALAGQLSSLEIQELRNVYIKALHRDHCYHADRVWAYAALRLEADLFHDVAAARALLMDAKQACAAHAINTRLTRSVSPAALEVEVQCLIRLGVAQALMELRHSTSAQALEVAQETLQHMPKTRDGALAAEGCGELCGLAIQLEPPASRGRAAMQVLQQWKCREPLALVAVAQLYYYAGKPGKALEQVLKAAQTSRGRCGDAIGLLWKMAEQPLMKSVMAPKLSPPLSVEEAEALDALPQDAIKKWVLAVAHRASALSLASAVEEEGKDAISGEGGAGKQASGGGRGSGAILRPNAGPVWVEVAKAQDPTNVTLLGYRRPIEEMLREVADRMVLTVKQ